MQLYTRIKLFIKAEAFYSWTIFEHVSVSSVFIVANEHKKKHIYMNTAALCCSFYARQGCQKMTNHCAVALKLWYFDPNCCFFLK